MKRVAVIKIVWVKSKAQIRSIFDIINECEIIKIGSNILTQHFNVEKPVTPWIMNSDKTQLFVYIDYYKNASTFEPLRKNIKRYDREHKLKKILYENTINR